MTLKERIADDIKTAMKAKDRVTIDTLKLAKAEIEKKESGTKKGGRVTLNDVDIEEILIKMSKDRHELVSQYTGNFEATGIVEDAKKEITVLESYLPDEMSEDEIRQVIKGYIADDSMDNNIGFLMGTFNKNHKGVAHFDNKLVSKVIKEELS